MTQYLQANLLALFAARSPIPYIPPSQENNSLPPYSGIASLINQFEDPSTVAPLPEGHPFETPRKRRSRINKERLEKHQHEVEELVKTWEPAKDPNATGDPYKTIFVGRLSYDTTEYKLKKEFDLYGPVKKVRIVEDKEGKPRGYGFVEYEREKDVKTAYSQADGKKVDNRRIVVDVERGRTDRSWRPRRLGGGLGFTRRGGDDVNQKYSGRPPMSRDGGEHSRERSRERDNSKYDRRDRERSRERSDRDRHRGDRDRYGSSSSSSGGHRSDRDRERRKY